MKTDQRSILRDLKVTNRPIGSIVRYEKNARRHGRRDLGLLMASIRENGFTNPILVDEASVIIAGHGRLAAATELGMTQVPVIVLDGLSEAQKKALRIADNKIALESTWSFDLLAEELSALVLDDFDLTLTGFETIEIEKILTPDIGAADEAPLPTPPDQPVSKPGDLYRLGDNLLFCGDALDPVSYETLLGAEKADMVFSDFPYNVPIKGHASGNGRKTHDEFRMASGEMSRQEFTRFLSTATSHCHTFSRDGSLHYLCADWRMIGLLTQVGEEQLGALFNIVVWEKANAGMGSFYRSQHEMIAIFKNGDGRHVNNIQLGRLGRNRTNVWHYPGATGFSKSRKRDLADHPTVKPVALVADAIRDATNPGDLVLDPFGGAGTTLIAAHKVGRRAALIEIEPKYVDVTLRRFRDETGIEPVLFNTQEENDNG